MSSTRRRMAALLAAAALVLAACGRGKDQAGAPAEPPVTILGPESIVVIDSVNLRTGPKISGTLQPEVEAQVRAEVGGTVLQTYAEQGQRVAKGTLLARIDQRAVEDAYLSAQSQVRSAEANRDVAQRNAERFRSLAKAGAVAERDLEQAESQATAAEAQLADARARLATAQKTLGYTRVTAPISGVVSERQASPGDVVQVGAALFTIVDPRSLRLQGTVPAEAVGTLKPGAPVEFTVTGYAGRTFAGRIDRINPTADPATRQVRVYVSIPNSQQALVAGLYAEGQVGTAVRHALLVPASAVDQRGVTPTVLRLRGGRAETVQVELGIKDVASDRIELRSGVARGDTLILASAGVTPGAAVRVQNLETASGDTGKGVR
ncbi:MAG TPA: efflux RND transporter periplasmic adaptor subunit [Gemmatimonadales bacterium]|nr:efflux RND transporter periplasmic adaptor subunit [Gemmatimonadales bacterium]